MRTHFAAAIGVCLAAIASSYSWAQAPGVPIGSSLGTNGVPSVISPPGVTGTMATAAPTAGAFSSILAASATRKGCLIQNVGTTLGFVWFGANGSATTSNTFQIAANGGTINCADNSSLEQGNVSATCASGTCAFIVKSE